MSCVKVYVKHNGLSIMHIVKGYLNVVKFFYFSKTTVAVGKLFN